jgi:hypothetical protein
MQCIGQADGRVEAMSGYVGLHSAIGRVGAVLGYAGGRKHSWIGRAKRIAL